MCVKQIKRLLSAAMCRQSAINTAEASNSIVQTRAVFAKICTPHFADGANGVGAATAGAAATAAAAAGDTALAPCRSRVGGRGGGGARPSNPRAALAAVVTSPEAGSVVRSGGEIGQSPAMAIVDIIISNI